MLAVGDKVVYPMHGAGIIEAIEEHEILGLRQRYYVMTMPYGGMRVMIPLQNVDSIGLREVIGEVEVPKVIKVLTSMPEEEKTSWNRRINIHLNKIKSGCVYQVAEVVRNLMLQDRQKKLSANERRLLETARHILISELVLVCDKDIDSIEGWINGLINENAPGN